MSKAGLAVFLGQPFSRDVSGYWVDDSFVKFVESFSDVYGPLTLFVQVEPNERRGVYRIDPQRFRVVPLPIFDQFSPFRSRRAFFQIRRELAAKVVDHRAVWVGGPHIVGREVVRLCRRSRVACFLMIRQNLREMVRYKTQGRRRLIAVFAAAAIDWRFRILARRHLTFVVGRQMYRAYGGEHSTTVHEICVSLLRKNGIPRTVPNRPADSPTRLLWVGRMSPEKGLPFLFKALAAFPEGDSAPTLTLVGTGDSRLELEALARDLGLGQRIHFAGHVPFGESLSAYYNRAHLFVLPSLTEGLPQVLLEAMAAGLPCVATTVGGIPSFVRDGQHGRLVPPADPEALHLAIKELVGDRAMRQRLSREALEKVRSHSLEDERQKIVEILGRRIDFRPRSCNDLGD